MNQKELTDEERRVLRVLRENRGLYLREIHQALTELETSRFSCSPNFGEGWNDERHEVKELRDGLNDLGLLENSYQSWFLSEQGRETSGQ